MTYIRPLVVLLALGFIVVSCSEKKGDERRASAPKRVPSEKSSESSIQHIPGDTVDGAFRYRFHPVISPNKLNFGDLFERCTYVALETKPECLLGPIRRILIYKDRFYILTQGVYCFDLKGKFLFAINHMGKGPDEYATINNFGIDHGLIYLNTPKKIMFYDTENGSLVRKVPLDFFIRSLYVDGKHVYMERFVSPGQKLDPPGRVLVSNTDDLKKIDYYFPEDQYTIVTEDQLTGSFGEASLIDPYFCRIYKFRGGKMHPHADFDFGDKRLTENEVNALVSERKAPNSKKGDAFQLTGLVESERYMGASLLLNNAYAVLLADKQNNSSLVYTAKELSSDVGKPFMFFPFVFEAASGDLVCSALDAMSLQLAQKDIEAKGIVVPDSDSDFHNYKAVVQWKSDDNPILALYQLKPIK